MIIQGDCLKELKKLKPNSVDTIITDPPYGLRFMGKKWDHDVPSIEVWQECLRVIKPGGTALIFAGSRTQHRMAVNIEDSGWILKDCIMWLYGSGFPKATDISKQLDKVIGKQGKGFKTAGDDGRKAEFKQDKSFRSDYGYKYEPIGEEAKLWNGWKSHGLKPSYEPVLWARKPLTSSSDYDSIIVELNNYLELLLWQSLAKLEKMDMSSSQEMALTLSSIASLWKNILEDRSTKENKFITLTETSLITELRTLKFLTLESTQVKDIQEKSKALGFPLSVYIAEKCLTEEKKNTLDTLKHIAQELATSELKENGIFAELVKNNSLLTILNNLNSVLLNVIGKIEERTIPNHEPILVAQKPNDGTYANNALKWGVSGLNIDGGRIGTEERTTSFMSKKDNDAFNRDDNWQPKDGETTATGRFPANCLLNCDCDLQGLNLSDVIEDIITNIKLLCQSNHLKSPVNNVDLKKYLDDTSKKLETLFAVENVDTLILEKTLGKMQESITTMDTQCSEETLMESMNTNLNTFISGRKKTEKSQEAMKYITSILSEMITDLKTSNVLISQTIEVLRTKVISGIQELKKEKSHQENCPVRLLDEQSGINASRFFYTSKASKAERNAGCEGLDEKPGGSNAKGYTKDVAKGLDRNRPTTNHHPTVKPLKLMEYLCTLTATPTGGTVLDPFMGSGTTGIACKNLNRKFIGIELNSEYVEIAKARIDSIPKPLL